MRSNLYPGRLASWVIMAVLSYLTISPLCYGNTTNLPPKTDPATKLAKSKPGDGAKAKTAPGKAFLIQPPKPVRLSTSVKKQVINDPIRFSLASNKGVIRANEPIELTITAQLLDIPASLMFFTEEAASFRLKVLPPAGFVTTGGTFQDLAGGKLSLREKPLVSYTIQGYFESTSPAMCFRLLRGGGQADNSSLFVEKASVCLTNGSPHLTARLATTAGVTSNNVTSGDCSGITLAASVSPSSVNASGQATLTASCAGCGTGGFDLFPLNWTILK